MQMCTHFLPTHTHARARVPTESEAETHNSPSEEAAARARWARCSRGCAEGGQARDGAGVVAERRPKQGGQLAGEERRESRVRKTTQRGRQAEGAPVAQRWRLPGGTRAPAVSARLEGGGGGLRLRVATTARAAPPQPSPRSRSRSRSGGRAGALLGGLAPPVPSRSAAAASVSGRGGAGLAFGSGGHSRAGLRT